MRGGKGVPDDESFTTLRGAPLLYQSRRQRNLVVIHLRVANGMLASMDLGRWKAGCAGPSWLGSWTVADTTDTRQVNIRGPGDRHLRSDTEPRGPENTRIA